MNQSTLLKSRAQLDAEPRVAQFEVQRGCATWQGKHSYPQIESDPFPVWVKLQRISVTCGGSGYRLTDEGRTELIARGWFGRDDKMRFNSVCEHMGVLIE